MPIRVCHISTVHPDNDVRIVQRECGALASAGYDVHLVIPTDRARIENGVTFHPIRTPRRRVFRMLFAPWTALRTALRTRAKIYHFHDPEFLPAAFVLRWLFRKHVAYDVHEAVAGQILNKTWIPSPLRRPVSFFYRVVERCLTPGLTFVLANERSVPDYPSTAYLVRNFPRLREPAPIPTPVSKRPQPPLLIYLGAVSEERGALVYIRLAGELARRGRDFRMMIIGQMWPPFDRTMQDEIDAQRVSDRVTFHGRMENSRAMEYVAQATIGLSLLLPNPNTLVALATKILEYMMVGTPVLASNFPHWETYVNGERSGLAVDPTRLDDIVRACERLLDDPVELDAMGASGAKAVRTKFNWSTEFTVLDRAYKDLLAK